MQIVYHQDLNLVEFEYDPDTSDDSRGIVFGPFEHDIEAESGVSISNLEVKSISFRIPVRAAIDNWSVQPLIVGDVNFDQQLNARDLDHLHSTIAAGHADLRLDLDSNQVVDVDDARFWVHDIADTYFGDSNLDGEFNSSDLVSVFSASEYEDELLGSSVANLPVPTRIGENHFIEFGISRSCRGLTRRLQLRKCRICVGQKDECH